MTGNSSMREKWFCFLKGDNVGPMVSPLCDDWSLDEPYRWPYDEPDPFPPGDPHHMVSQQMAMAGLCGWDPTLLAWFDYPPRNPDARSEVRRQEVNGRTHVESHIHTPYGDLTCVEEFAVTSHTIKPWLQTEADYRKALWLTQQQLDYDEDAAIADGRLRFPVLLRQWDRVDFPGLFPEARGPKHPDDLRPVAGGRRLYPVAHLRPSENLPRSRHLQRVQARNIRNPARRSPGRPAQPERGTRATRPGHRHQGQSSPRPFTERPGRKNPSSRAPDKRGHSRLPPRRRSERRRPPQHPTRPLPGIRRSRP